jgi:hypothetical protein
LFKVRQVEQKGYMTEMENTGHLLGPSHLPATTAKRAIVVVFGLVIFIGLKLPHLNSI